MANGEPQIIINSELLNTAEAMTIRVALETFAMTLMQDGLGDDEHGKAMTKGYLRSIDSIRTRIHKKE